jgi:hypothetical protein
VPEQAKDPEGCENTKQDKLKKKKKERKEKKKEKKKKHAITTSYIVFQPHKIKDKRKIPERSQRRKNILLIEEQE